MYKTSKPGQIAYINGIPYRAKKRTLGCKGCALDSINLCPNITDKRYETEKPLKCDEGDFILVKEKLSPYF